MRLRRRYPGPFRLGRFRSMFPFSKQHSQDYRLSKKRVNDYNRPFIQNRVGDHINRLQNEIEYNLSRLPLRFNRSEPPFVHVPHLMAIYEESYNCIIYGQYHSGILLLGQLLEFTVKEIYKIRTGKTKTFSFDDTIHFLAGERSDRATNAWISTNPAIVHPIFTKQISALKNDIRNPYTHLDFKKIFKKQTIPVLQFEIGTDPKKYVDRIGQAIKKFEAPDFKPEEISPAIDPLIATITKSSLDKARVFNLAFNVYLLFWVLLDLYLNKEAIQQYVTQYGSPFTGIPLTDLDESS